MGVFAFVISRKFDASVLKQFYATMRSPYENHQGEQWFHKLRAGGFPLYAGIFNSGEEMKMENMNVENKQELLKDILSFDKMLTPLLIKLVYYLGLAFIAVMAILMVITAISTKSILLFVVSIAVLIFGPLIVRVLCEMTILAFRIYDKLVDINNAQAKNG